MQTFVKYASDKGLEYRAYTELSQLNKTETTQLKHEQKTELSFPRGSYADVKYMKRCLIFIRQMEIKTMLAYATTHILDG